MFIALSSLTGSMPRLLNCFSGFVASPSFKENMNALPGEPLACAPLLLMEERGDANGVCVCGNATSYLIDADASVPAPLGQRVRRTDGWRWLRSDG